MANIPNSNQYSAQQGRLVEIYKKMVDVPNIKNYLMQLQAEFISENFTTLEEKDGFSIETGSQQLTNMDFINKKNKNASHIRGKIKINYNTMNIIAYHSEYDAADMTIIGKNAVAYIIIVVILGSLGSLMSSIGVSIAGLIAIVDIGILAYAVFNAMMQIRERKEILRVKIVNIIKRAELMNRSIGQPQIMQPQNPINQYNINQKCPWGKHPFIHTIENDKEQVLEVKCREATCYNMVMITYLKNKETGKYNLDLRAPDFSTSGIVSLEYATKFKDMVFTQLDMYTQNSFLIEDLRRLFSRKTNLNWTIQNIEDILELMYTNFNDIKFKIDNRLTPDKSDDVIAFYRVSNQSDMTTQPLSQDDNITNQPNSEAPTQQLEETKVPSQVHSAPTKIVSTEKIENGDEEMTTMERLARIKRNQIDHTKSQDEDGSKNPDTLKKMFTIGNEEEENE